MPAGKETEMYGMVPLSDVGAVIRNALEEDVTFEQVLKTVMYRYETGRETAEPDLVRPLEKLRSFNGILE